MKNKGPLSGITVIDLTAMISGPVCTMMLGDQGADVIKVEPLTGELTRKVGASKNGMTTSFLCANRSKRSLTLNLKDPKGISILKKLIKKADVLVQNFRPGTMKRMGLSYEEVKKLNKEIIYTSISGFGEKGPYSSHRVYDPVIQALSGLADIQRDQKTNFPKMVRTIIPDKTTGMAAAQAISSALFYKERYGKGQHIKLAMLDVMVAYLWPEGSASLSFVGEEGDPSKGQMGLDLVFETKDNKYITAGAVTDQEWLGMCNAFDRKDLLSDPRSFNRIKDSLGTIVSGLKFSINMASDRVLRGSIGVEHDLIHNVDKIEPTGIIGLSTVSLENEFNPTRPVLSLALDRYLSSNEKITATFQYQDLPYKSKAEANAYFYYTIGL